MPHNWLKSWSRLGGLPAGTVAAIALAKDIAFVGTKVGVYRWACLHDPVPQWERLINSPIGVVALAISPNFAHDGIVLAGTEAGIAISRDAGISWYAARLPASLSMVLALCCSPNFGEDGIVLAGTLEDGIWYSESHGERWRTCNFGLLDATVYSLAISPNFAHDGTIYAGAATAIYHSYNGARAWKQLDFPDDAPPILSLAVSPDANVLYVGTEREGLYRSLDRGESWDRTSLPASSANALLALRDRVLVATESGVYQSKDEGETWHRLVDAPNAICLSANDRIAIAGLIDAGAWMTANASDDIPWHSLPVPPIRSVTGVSLSPQFERDGIAFMYGPQEGVWRTKDGGVNWTCTNDSLPSADIHALAISPNFAEDRAIVATSPDGVFISADAGERWRALAQVHAGVVAFSPNGSLLAIALHREGIQVSNDLGETWRPVAGPWDDGGNVVALAVADDERFRVAVLDRGGDSLTVWFGTSEQFEPVLRAPVNSNSVVVFWIPEWADAHDQWYLAYGNRIWVLVESSVVATSTLFDSTQAQRENVVALTGIRHMSGQTMLACTNRHVYRSRDGMTWEAIHNFEEEMAIAFVLSPTYPYDATVYALLLGGTFIRLFIPSVDPEESL